VLAWFITFKPEVIGGLVAGVGLSIFGWRLDRRTARIEVLANGRVEALLVRTAQLEDKIRELGHQVPPDPAVTVLSDHAKE